MEKWILIVNMIITMQGDNEPEIKHDGKMDTNRQYGHQSTGR